jgi:hypothetical protein
MFYPPNNALKRISPDGEEKKERELKKIIDNLDNKNDVLNSNRNLHEEKEMLNTVVSEGNEAGVNTSRLDKSAKNLNEIVKRNDKASRKILKRKL